MTSEQKIRIEEFEREVIKRGSDADLTWEESRNDLTYGFLFGNFGGVTLTISPKGLISIPAVRSYHPPSYPTPAIAAASAKELWEKQKKRDEADLETARSRSTGHLSPIVDWELRCENRRCPCLSETVEARQRRSQGGFNTDPDRCH